MDLLVFQVCSLEGWFKDKYPGALPALHHSWFLCLTSTSSLWLLDIKILHHSQDECNFPLRRFSSSLDSTSFSSCGLFISLCLFNLINWSNPHYTSGNIIFHAISTSDHFLTDLCWYVNSVRTWGFCSCVKPWHLGWTSPAMKLMNEKLPKILSLLHVLLWAKLHQIDSQNH